MKKALVVLGMLLTTTLLLGTVGCFDSGSDNTSPVGANIAGKWTGKYYREGGGGQDITATVSQDGGAVAIKTSKSSPTGRHLTGTIDPDGNMTMTDADDGEVWSNFGRVTDNYIRIGDYTRHPTPHDDPGSVPLYIIELSR